MEKLNYDDWKFEAICTGKGDNRIDLEPCYNKYTISSEDIIVRKNRELDKKSLISIIAWTFLGESVTYGFVCPECGCFTMIPDWKIPKYIQIHAKQFEGADENRYNNNK